MRHALAVLAFAALIALCARIAVPMVPVPMTMQTFAVLLAGAMLGPVAGAGAVLLYLAAGALGLPVFSEGGSGLDSLIGPTAGYLWSFPLAAAMAGRLSRQGRLRPWPVGVALLWALHLLILAPGAAWLSRVTGLEAAAREGVLPFLIGAGVKSALVILAVGLRDRFAPRQIRSS